MQRDLKSVKIYMEAILKNWTMKGITNWGVRNWYHVCIVLCSKSVRGYITWQGETHGRIQDVEIEVIQWNPNILVSQDMKKTLYWQTDESEMRCKYLVRM